MNRDRNALKAGIFIICSVIASGAIILSIRGGGHAIQPMAERKVTFQISDDLSGLRAGDDVRLGGFRIGTVRNIDVVQPAAEGDEPHILVTFSMPARYRLHEDSMVVAESTLTGVASLNIERLGKGTDVEEAVGHPSSMSQLFSGLARVTPKINVVADRASALLAHVDAKIDPVVSKYEGVTDRAGETLVQVRDLVGDTKPDIRGTLKNLNGVTGTANQRLPALLDQVKTAIDKVQITVDTARSALVDLKKITETGKAIVVGNRGKLESMVTALKATSDNLKAASIEVRRSPWRLLYKPSANEMANLNLYDAARQFADGADNLTDAATALRDAVNDGSADKQQVEKLMQQLDASFANFRQVEDKLWSAVRQ